MNKIRVLIVDDSATVRQVLSRTLEGRPFIEAVDIASDPIFAMDRMKKNTPDVIILDIEMPRMDGLTFLRKIMEEKPIPVIICSSLTTEGTSIAFDAMKAGAVDIIAKPTVGLKDFLNEESERFIRAVEAASKSRPTVNLRQRRVDPPVRSQALGAIPSDEASLLPPQSSPGLSFTTDKVIAIGASTGGTVALEDILVELPPDLPGIVIVQHMPENFTRAFAERLNSLSRLQIKEAVTGDHIMPGTALIAPGNHHMVVVRNGARYDVMVKDGPMVNHHRPSVDLMFRSVARAAGKNAMGVILTGMGADGAQGMKEMFDIGSHTIAQDRESSVVYGMPMEAVKLGGVSQSLPLKDIARAIQLKCQKGF